jgi:hypothetical protein
VVLRDYIPKIVCAVVAARACMYLALQTAALGMHIVLLGSARTHRWVIPTVILALAILGFVRRNRNA